MTENVRENEALDCPNHRDKICILRRLKMKYYSNLVKSLNSELWTSAMDLALSNLKKELERVQRERDKANLDRDEANLERDQANLERDQAILEHQVVLDLNLAV